MEAELPEVTKSGLTRGCVLIRPKNSKEATGMEPPVRLGGQVQAANKGKDSGTWRMSIGTKSARQTLKVGLPDDAMGFDLWCPHGKLSQVSPTLHEDIWMAFYCPNIRSLAAISGYNFPSYNASSGPDTE